jgi:hypothetical protein
VIFLNTKVKVPFKMTASSISGFVSCVVMFYYFYYVADLSFQSYLGNSLSILNVYNYACGLFLFAIFISSMVLIIRDIFSKLSGVSGSLIALVISVVGTAISYVLWSFGGVLPFLSSLPMTVSIFWVMFILFILGIAVSIMSIAFKLIFKDTKTEKIEQIDIDVDEDNFVNVNKEDSK